jgi:carboxyl-terminal processing protease
LGIDGPRQTAARAAGIAAAVAGTLALGACAHRPTPVAYDRAVGLETFDAAWRLVHETYFDTTFGGVDWVALRDSLRPRAADARSRDALRSLIDGMLGRLGRSHFTLIPRELADTGAGADELQRGSVGLDVRLLDGRLVVTEVDAGGPAARAGVRPGWVVVAVGRDSASALLARLRARERAKASVHRIETEAWGTARSRLNPPLDSAVDVVFLDQADRTVTLHLLAQRAPGEPVRFGSLPLAFTRFSAERRTGPGGVRVGVLRFNVWMVPLMRQIDAAVDSFRTLDGIVLDLRGNTGGVSAMIGGVAGHFLEGRDTLGLMITRRNRLALVANPRLVSADARPVRPFAGPVAVLVDEASASATEAFAGGMQVLGRVRVFGGRSMGAVLGALWDRLPNGDQLYHAILAFDIRGADLEGRGVAPDEPVGVTRADLLAGRDPVAEAAVRWIAAQPKRASP